MYIYPPPAPAPPAPARESDGALFAEATPAPSVPFFISAEEESYPSHFLPRYRLPPSSVVRVTPRQARAVWMFAKLTARRSKESRT